MSSERPLSALPSPIARILAFVLVIFSGVAGALIGYQLVDVQVDNAGNLPLGIGLLCGALIAASGTAIISVLVLRATGEWADYGDRTR